MKQYLILILFPLLLILIAPPAAATSTPLCQKTWGGSSYDDGRAVALDSAGNIYVAGSTKSFGAGAADVLLLKYSPLCVLLWQRTWGGSSTDIGSGVAVDSSGNIYVTGSTRSFNATVLHNQNVFLLKFNSTGNLQWQTTWGGNTLDNFALGISTDSSGNVYLTGSTASFGAGGLDVFLLKFNSTGNLQWQRTWGGTGSDEGFAVAVDSPNRIYVTGSTRSFGAGLRDVFLLQLNSTGGLQWQRTWGGSLNETGRGVAVDSSGNVYVTGSTDSGSSIYNAFLLRFDSGGSLVWQRTWGGTTFDEGRGVAVDSSGNIYLTGITLSFGAGADDVFLLKFDPTGSLKGQKTWGGVNPDQGLGIAVDSSGNAVVTGFVNEAPPYTLGSPAGFAGTPLFSVSNSGNFTLGIPSFSPRSVAGIVSTPMGIETYAGLSDVFVLKYGSSIFVPTFPLPIVILTVATFARVSLMMRRRRY